MNSKKFSESMSELDSKYVDEAIHYKKKKNKKVRETGRRTRTGTVSHGVGIGVPQMPMNRAADDIQEQVGQYAMERLIHYQDAILKGIVKR